MKTTTTKNKMELLIIKMLISWAIMLIGFVALFAGCNNVKKTDTVGTAADAARDSVQSAEPDNTRTDGIRQERPLDTVIKSN